MIQQQMDFQIKRITDNRRRHGRYRRWLAMLSAVVIFFTMSTLKINVDALERVATCGYQEHTHTQACYSSNSPGPVCGLIEHTHTDACYQKRPLRDAEASEDRFTALNADVKLVSGDVVVTAEAGDDLAPDAEDVETELFEDDVEERGEAELGEDGLTEDLEPEQDGDDALPDDTVDTDAPGTYRYDFLGGSFTLLSEVIARSGVPMNLSAVTLVGPVETEGAPKLSVEPIGEHDIIITAVESFSAAELAICAGEDIEIVTLLNAVAVPAEEPTEPEVPADEDEPVVTVDEDEPVVTVDEDEPVVTVDEDEPTTPVEETEGEDVETEPVNEEKNTGDETEDVTEDEIKDETEEETRDETKDETEDETEEETEDETEEETEDETEEETEDGTEPQTDMIQAGNVTIVALGENTLPGDSVISYSENADVEGALAELNSLLNGGRRSSRMMAAASAATGRTEGYAVFDISVLNDGQAISETGDVQVTVRPGNVDMFADVPGNATVDGVRFVLYHLHDGVVAELPVTVSHDEGRVSEVVFNTDCFSSFILKYTVDFHYNGNNVSIEGNTQVLLSTLIRQLGIVDDNGEPVDVVKVTSVSFTDDRLVTVEKVCGEIEVNGETVDVGDADFLLTSDAPFTSAEQLILTLEDDQEIVVDVTDEMQTTSPWELGNEDNTQFLHVSAESSVTGTEQNRDVSFKLTFTYSLEEEVVHAIDAYEGNPVLEYDLSSFAAQFPGEIKNNSNGVISIGTRRLGTYVVRDNKVILTFTDPSYFDGRSVCAGYFTITVQTHEELVKEDGEYKFTFPGTDDTIPIHYKKSVEEGTKSVNAVRNSDDSYTLNYTANINVNSDLDSMTFNDTLSGLQTLNPDSVKINGQTVSNISQDDQNFSFDVASALGGDGVAKGSYQVTYSTTVTGDQLKAMQNDTTTEKNTVTWLVNGDKDVDGGHTEIILDKPQEPIPVTKTISATASQPGDTLTYTVTYGNDKTELSGFHISDYMTDVVIPQDPQDQISITANGQTRQISFGSQAIDASYSKGMVNLFDYTFPEGTPGYGPVVVTYTVKLIDAETAKANGIYDTTDVTNTAREHRQNTTDTKKTTVTYEKEPHYTVDKVAVGTYAPGSTIDYTLTIGDANTNMAGVNIRDVMTDLQTLQDDVMITVGGQRMKLNDYVAGAVTYTDDGQYSTNDVELFNFNMPSDAGNGPVVIKYTTQVINEATAHGQGIYGDKPINNIGYAGKDSDGTNGTGPFGEYPIEKEVFQNDADANHQTVEMGSLVHYKLTFGSADMDMGGVFIYDEFTDLQKLEGNVTVTKADGTAFIMPTASGQWEANGVVWPFFDDDIYDSFNTARVFYYRLPNDIGNGPIVVEYDARIISEEEANNSGIQGDQTAFNTFRIGSNQAQTDVKIEFPKDPSKTPDIRKEFCDFDLENNIVYWNIIVEKTDDSAYPLENVVVREKFSDIHITEPSQGYNDNGSFSGANFDSLRAVVTTDDGTVLTPGVDYTVDKERAQFTFPLLTERVTIKLAFLSPAKIVDGYKVKNTAELVSPNKAVQADWQYDQPTLSMYKNGAYTEDDRIIQWTVRINPSKKEFTDSDPIRVEFTDAIPEGLTLLNYRNKTESNPSVHVKIEGALWYEQDVQVTVDGNNTIEPVDIAAHGYYFNPDNHAGLNGNMFIVTYYTRLSVEEWNRITSSASGSETFQNKVEVTAGDHEKFEATDKVTVTSSGYLKKYDDTLKDEHGNLVVDENGEESKEIRYTVDINPNGYVLNEGRPLSLTDYISTNMDLSPDSVSICKAHKGPDGRLVSDNTVPPDLQVSYNDDVRLLSIRNIPDKTPLILTYICYARAQGEDTFRNTATLIGGGSHSSTVEEKHTIQTDSVGVWVDGIHMNMLKIDENNISKGLNGAQFQLYECKLAIGDLTNPETYPQSYWDGLLATMDRITAGNGTAEEIARIREQFVITEYVPFGDPAVTGDSGYTDWTGLNEHKLYCWKEVQAPDNYTGYEDYHYFVGYQHIDVNAAFPYPPLPVDEQLDRKHAAWALDDACQLANGIRVASMSNLTTWTATNVETQFTSISATKIWENDSDNLFETRPTGGIRLQLWQIKEDGTRTAYEDPVAINVDEHGDWPTYIWNRLPSNSAEDGTYRYTVVEEKVDGYSTTYSDDGNGQTSGTITVTNRMIPKSTNIYVKKVFEDGEGDERPEEIKVSLMVIKTDKQGNVSEPEEYMEARLNAGNGWKWCWEKLPTTMVELDNGTKVGYDLTYTVVEDTKALENAGFNYTVSYSDNNEGVVETSEDSPLTITNAKPQKGSLKLSKIAKVGDVQASTLTDARKTMADGTYTFTVTGPGADGTTSVEVKITIEGGVVTAATVDGETASLDADGFVEVPDLEAGEYTIIETARTNMSAVPVAESIQVTVQAGVTGAEAPTATITNNVPLTSVEITKTWAGDEDDPDLRPTATEYAAKVHLYAGSTEVTGQTPTVTDNGDNTYTVKYENLPAKDKTTGNDITYTVKEGAVEGYTASTTEGIADGGTLTNTRDKGNLKIQKVTQVNGETDSAGLIDGVYEFTVTGPGESANITATVKITMENGVAQSAEIVTTATGVTVETAADGVVTVKGLPTGTYKVAEDTSKNPDGVSLTGTNEQTLTVVKDGPDAEVQTAEFTNNAEVGSLKITKIAKVGDDQASALTDARKTMTDGTYTFNVFTDDQATVPAKTVDGTEVGDVTIEIENGEIKTVAEVANLVPGDYYVKEIRGTNAAVTLDTTIYKVTVEARKSGDQVETGATAEATNTLPVGSLTVTKTVYDKRTNQPMDIVLDYPVEITVKIGETTYYVQDANGTLGTQAPEESLKVSTVNGLSISNLPYGEYTVTEKDPETVEVSGYRYVEVQGSSQDEDTATVGETAGSAALKNYYEEVVTVKVKKVWVDATPLSSLVVHLSNGNLVTLSDENNWEDSIGNLPKYDDSGNLIEYSWMEDALPPGYYLLSITEAIDPDDGAAITTLTNSFTDHYVPKTTIKGRKIWDDDGREDRPNSITVILNKDGAEYKRITVQKPTGEGADEDQWPFEFTNLPVFNDDGTVIQYTVQEVLPEGYTSVYGVQVEFEQATYTPVDVTGTIVNSGEGSQVFELCDGTDLGYIVIRHGNDFIIWTPRVATAEEIQMIKQYVLNLGTEQFSGITSASGNRMKVISGVPTTVDVGNKHAVSVYMNGSKVMMKFLNPNAWSDFAYGKIRYDYTPAGGEGGGTITNTRKVTDFEFGKKWIDLGQTEIPWDGDIKLTIGRRKADTTDDNGFSLVYNVTKAAVEAAATGTAEFFTGTDGDPKLTLTITTEGNVKKYHFRIVALPRVDDDGGVYTYYVKETNAQLDGYMSPSYSTPGAPTNADHATNGGTIINQQAGGYALPSTGGAGVTMIYVGGASLMLLAVLAYIWGNRRRFTGDEV